MKIKIVFFSVLVMSLSSEYCFSQDSDSLNHKAKFYYANEEYLLAIPCFSNLIVRNPNDYKSYQYRGNCYLELGQNQKAILDFHSALKLQKNNELLYNLGDAFEKSNNLDSSIYYFSKFIENEPNRPDGYTRLCIIYMYSHPEWGDTAIYFASQAVKKNPENIVNLNFLAMAYYSAGHYKSALETAMIGLAIDSSFSLLNQTAGISCFFMKDYTSAISYFSRAYKYNPKDFTLLDYKIQSILLKNTNPDHIKFQSDQSISLPGISSESIRKSEEKIRDTDGIYAYKKLLQKFRYSPISMSIDEYFMLYLGYSLQPEYSPYKRPGDRKDKENDLTIEADRLEEMLKKNPTDFPVYLELADIYQELGDESNYFENRFRYFGFIESIKATGDGLSAETAFIINDIRHEYSIMVSLGYRPKGQKLIRQKKHVFDVISGTDQKNNETEIFFNIDKPFDTLPKKLAN